MKKITSVALFLFSFSQIFAQTELATGLKLKSEKKWNESFQIFQQLLKSDSNNVDYLTNTAYLYCKLGNLKSSESEKQYFFHRAEYLSRKAIALANSSGQAHYNLALALGRINENASSKQKIANAKVIKLECDEAIKYDPKLAGAYHILGRWHRTIANFNFIEKAAINTLYGGVPEGGSYDSAIANFTKAIALEPDDILHKFELAETYRERNNKGDDILSNVWFKKVLDMKALDESDKAYQKEAASKIK